jgi:hypothetical protein
MSFSRLRPESVTRWIARPKETTPPGATTATANESASVSVMTETVSVAIASEATVTEAILIVSLIGSDTVAATWIGTASDADEIAAGHDLQSRMPTRMAKALFAIGMEVATAAASILLIGTVAAAGTTVAETTIAAAHVLVLGPLAAPAMMAVTDIVSVTVLGTAADVMMTAVVVAAPPRLRKTKTTVISVLSSCSRFRSVQRLATFLPSSKPLAPWLKLRSLRTVSLDDPRGE